LEVLIPSPIGLLISLACRGQLTGWDVAQYSARADRVGQVAGSSDFADCVFHSVGT